MRLLLDTQAFLWFILAEPRLSATALGLITDPLNHKHVSPASYWEIANQDPPREVCAARPV